MAWRPSALSRRQWYVNGIFWSTYCGEMMIVMRSQATPRITVQGSRGILDNLSRNRAGFRSTFGPVLADTAPTTGHPREADRRCYLVPSVQVGTRFTRATEGVRMSPTPGGIAFSG
jgi:hypothetical protein